VVTHRVIQNEGKKEKNENKWGQFEVAGTFGEMAQLLKIFFSIYLLCDCQSLMLHKNAYMNCKEQFPHLAAT